MNFRVFILSVFVCLFVFAAGLSANNLFLLPEGTVDHTVRVYNGNPLVSAAQFQSGPAPVLNIVPAADGSAYFAVVNSATEAVVKLNASFGEVSRTATWGAPVRAAALTPDGKYLLVAADTLRVFNAATNAEVASISVGSEPIDIAVSMDSTYALVLSSNSQRVYRVDLATLAQTGSLAISGQSTGITVAPDMKFYVANTNSVRIIDGGRMAETGRIALTSTPAKLQITPDGKHALAVGTIVSSNIAMWVFDLELKQVTRTLPIEKLSGVTPRTFEAPIQIVSNQRAIVRSPQTKSIFAVSIPGGDLSLLNFGNINDNQNIDAIAASNELPNAKYLYFAKAFNIQRIDLATDKISGSATPIAKEPARMTYGGPPSMAPPSDVIHFSNEQHIAEGELFRPLVVQVLDAAGLPVYNASVEWDSTLPGVVFEDAFAVTNAKGFAKARVLTGLNTGIIPVTATVGGIFQIDFDLRIGQVVGPDNGGLRKVSGDGQLISENSIASRALVVELRNPDGTPVAGKSINWAIASGSGVMDRVISTTDSIGRAEAFFRSSYVNPLTSFGATVITATADEKVVTFFVTAYPLTNESGGFALTPNGSVIKPAMSSNLVGKRGSVLPDAVRARVTASVGIYAGKGIPNVGLVVGTANAPENGPAVSCVGGYVLTESNPTVPGSDGVASCDLVLSGQLGTAPLRIDIGGGFRSFSDVTITILPGDPAIAVKVAGDNQNGEAGATLPIPLQVEIQDGSGARLVETAVAWQVLQGSVTLSNASAKTDGNGIATATATLGNTPGVARVRVTAGAATATFTMNVLVSVTEMNKISGDGQIVLTGQQFGQPLIVELKDEDGAAVANQLVSFAVASGNASVSSPTATTDASGRASVTVLAGNTPGGVTVNASYPGFQPISFSLTVLPPGPAVVPNNFTNGASGAVGVVPGSVVKVYGTGIAAGIENCVIPYSQVGGLPLELAGVTVEFGDQMWSPIYHVCNVNGVESIAIQAPFELSPGLTPVTIRVNGGETIVQNVNVLPVQPGIFETMGADSKRYGVVMRPDGSYVSANNPARRGEILAMFTTGMGAITPAGMTNASGVAGQEVLADIQVGINYQGVRVLRGEYAQNMIGVYVILFEVPEDAPSGAEIPLGLSVGTPDNRVFGNGSTIAIQ